MKKGMFWSVSECLKKQCCTWAYARFGSNYQVIQATWYHSEVFHNYDPLPPFSPHFGSWPFLLHLQIYPDGLKMIKQWCDVSHDMSVFSRWPLHSCSIREKTPIVLDLFWSIWKVLLHKSFLHKSSSPLFQHNKDLIWKVPQPAEAAVTALVWLKL